MRYQKTCNSVLGRDATIVIRPDRKLINHLNVAVAVCLDGRWSCVKFLRLQLTQHDAMNRNLLSEVSVDRTFSNSERCSLTRIEADPYAPIRHARLLALLLEQERRLSFRSS